jgi:hypothetical protein
MHALALEMPTCSLTKEQAVKAEMTMMTTQRTT